MFGTIARYRLKPGREAELLEDLKGFEANPAPGWMSSTVFRSTSDPNELWISVAFESEEAYRRNADSPESDRRFRAMVEKLEAEPEWHDGHVIHQAMRQPATA